MNKNVPNIITAARILLIPLFIALFYLYPASIFPALVFGIAGLTDLVDGKIARKYDLVSTSGKFLDTLADKLLITSALVVLCEFGLFPSWCVIIVLAREFAITSLRVLAINKGMVMAADMSGKVKMTVQSAGLSAILLIPAAAALFPGADAWGWVNAALTGIILAVTLWSGVDYMWRYRGLFRD